MQLEKWQQQPCLMQGHQNLQLVKSAGSVKLNKAENSKGRCASNWESSCEAVAVSQVSGEKGMRCRVQKKTMAVSLQKGNLFFHNSEQRKEAKIR